MLRAIRILPVTTTASLLLLLLSLLSSSVITTKDSTVTAAFCPALSYSEIPSSPSSSTTITKTLPSTSPLLFQQQQHQRSLMSTTSTVTLLSNNNNNNMSHNNTKNNHDDANEKRRNDSRNQQQQQQQQQQTLPRVDKIVSVASTKWLALETYHYTDEEGKSRQWDVATRTTKPSVSTTTTNSNSDTSDTPGNTHSTADAVVIIPLLYNKNNNNNNHNENELETLLVEQYRPPLQQTTMEFPAGLVDQDESVEAAALRELREETGYIGERCKVVPQVSRAVCMSPGLATETVHVVMIHVDLSDPYNANPTSQLDDGEYVTVHRVSLNDGLQKLLDTCPAMPIMGLYLFAVGFTLGSNSKSDNSQTAIADDSNKNAT